MRDMLRCGGPGLKATQQYPPNFGRKLAQLARAHAGVPLLDVQDEPNLVGLVWSEDPWYDADMLRIHGFLRRCYAEKPWC